MTYPGPLVIVGFLLAVAAVLQILRRWTVVMAWIAAAATGAVGTLIALVPLDETFTVGPLTIALGEPLVVLGRVVVIQPVDRLPLAFISLTASVLFLIAWRLLPHSNFFPVGVAIVGLLSAALTVQQVVYAALFVEMAAILCVFPLREPHTGPEGNQYGRQPRGGLQYLTYATLALPGLMITQLLLEQFAIFPGDLSLLRSATILLGLSFAILLGAVPFQSWLSAVATDGSPPVVTFLFTVNLGTVWFLLLAYLESYRWLGEQAEFASLFTSVGLLMMVIGGALAASQRQLGRIVGYATLVDNGAMFVALGTRQASGVTLTLIMLMARPLALGLMTLGLDGLRRFGKGRDDVGALTGAAWQVPWRTLAFMVGGIAMAGFPLSLGFSARWGLYRLMAEANLFRAILALSGSAGVMMGLVNSVRFLLAPVGEDHERSAVNEDPIVLFLILTLIVSTFLLGVFPQLFSRVALQITQAFTFFTQ
ncbi:MAG: proton-conducting transporter membrane subunit [Anaerolineae bacterium]